jgi:hypothetical protein
LTLTVDDIGLRYDIALPETTFAADLAVSLRRGDITGSSFAFRTREDKWSTEKRDGKTIKVRELRSVATFDVGPVTYPAYSGTSTEVATRSLDAFTQQTEARERQTATRHRRAKLARLRSVER